MTNLMDIRAYYRKATQNIYHTIKQYRPPALYIGRTVEPKGKKLLASLNNVKKKYPSTKPFFIDEKIVKPVKNNPSPNKYQLAINIRKQFKSVKSLKKVGENLSKRKTYIDNIEDFEHKHKYPGVGKYNLREKHQNSKSSVKMDSQKSRYDRLQDIKFIAAGVPGAGQHNPHKSISKIKSSLVDRQYWKNRLQKQKQRRKIKQASSLSPCSYNPVKQDTFEGSSKHINNRHSSMKLLVIDKRKGVHSMILSPGPGKYNLINKWSSTKLRRQKINGSLRLLQKISRSVCSLSSVYHEHK